MPRPDRARPPRRLPFLLAALALALAGPVRAIDPALPLARLHHDSWTSRDGMPGDVWEIAQDRAGFLWFATASGLYRFDGVRFEQIHALGGTPLLSNVMATVRAFDDGSLWIGYRFAALGVYQDGVLRHYGPADGYQPGLVYAIVRDERGRTWTAASSGLFVLDGARWHRIDAEHGLAAAPLGLTQDRAGRIWVHTRAGLYYRTPGSDRFVDAGLVPGDIGVVEDPAGAEWLYDFAHMTRLPDRLAQPPAPRRAAAAPYSYDVLFDRDGNLWHTDCDGLCRIAPALLAGRRVVAQRRGDAERAPRHALSGNPMTLFEDREGNVWVGTRTGVDRFRRDRVATLALPPDQSYFALARDGADRLWIRAEELHRPHLWLRDATGLHAQPERDVTTLATGADGALLLGRAGHIEWRLGGARRRIPFPTDLTPDGRVFGARALLDDGGGLWAGFNHGRLYRYAGGAWLPAHAYGLPETEPVCMDRGAGGAVWFGYHDGGVAELRAGRVRCHDLGLGVIGALAEVGGVRIAAGDKGLAILAGTRFVPLRVADPQALAGVTGIVRDTKGDLWLNGSKGLVHLPAAAWDAVLRDPRAPVAGYELFDAVDGYPGIAQFRAGQPSLLQDRGGTLWFTGSTGAASLDPRRLPRNPVAPPVHILGVKAGGHAFAPATALALSPGTRDLQVTYTAPSFTMPERVRFRYRLEGVDAGWQDAGTRRTAYYNNLGPGAYRFEVMAANEDGVWSAAPARLDVRIAPAFVQGAGFKLLCGLALALAVWLLLRLRLRRATAQLRRLLRERAGERERIARTLHDTLMQSVQALLMLFERARDRLPPDNAALPLLDQTLGQARATLSEGRDELSALRGAAAPERDLVGALVPLGHLLGAQFGIGFTVAVGERRTLWHGAAIEICFIAREALQNAFRHARAATVTLEVEFGAREFVLRVRDDGRGLAPDAARPGHWGLAGMRERAAAIGARLAIDAAPGGGTLVQLALDADAAYAPRARDAWWRRARAPLPNRPCHDEGPA